MKVRKVCWWWGGGGLFDYSVTPGPGPDLELDNSESEKLYFFFYPQTITRVEGTGQKCFVVKLMLTNNKSNVD